MTTVIPVNISFMDTLIKIFGLLFLGAAIYQRFLNGSWPTKSAWYVMNILAVVFSVRVGYVSTAPERIRHANPDAIFCGIILFFTPLFAIWCVNLAFRRWKHETVHRASWDRNPLDWWHDPLQSLFMSAFVSAAMAVGAALREPTVGSTGFWMVGMYASVAAGLSTGQILAHRIYRDRIVPAATEASS